MYIHTNKNDDLILVTLNKKREKQIFCIHPVPRSRQQRG